MPSHSVPSGRQGDSTQAGRDSGLARFGLALATWSERWFPDPLVFALAGIVIVFIFGLCLRESASKLAIQGAKNFWTLVPFTMQMAMIIIGGYVVASTPAVYWVIQRLARFRQLREARLHFGFFPMLTSLISWGFSLIFSGLLVRELVRRVDGIDYRAIGAAAYLGLGSIWALGLVFVSSLDDGYQGIDTAGVCLTSAD